MEPSAEPLPQQRLPDYEESSESELPEPSYDLSDIQNVSLYSLGHWIHSLERQRAHMNKHKDKYTRSERERNNLQLDAAYAEQQRRQTLQELQMERVRQQRLHQQQAPAPAPKPHIRNIPITFLPPSQTLSSRYVSPPPLHIRGSTPQPPSQAAPPPVPDSFTPITVLPPPVAHPAPIVQRPLPKRPKPPKSKPQSFKKGVKELFEIDPSLIPRHPPPPPPQPPQLQPQPQPQPPPPQPDPVITPPPSPQPKLYPNALDTVFGVSRERCRVSGDEHKCFGRAFEATTRGTYNWQEPLVNQVGGWVSGRGVSICDPDDLAKCAEHLIANAFKVPVGIVHTIAGGAGKYTRIPQKIVITFPYERNELVFNLDGNYLENAYDEFRRFNGLPPIPPRAARTIILSDSPPPPSPPPPPRRGPPPIAPRLPTDKNYTLTLCLNDDGSRDERIRNTTGNFITVPDSTEMSKAFILPPTRQLLHDFLEQTPSPPFSLAGQPLALPPRTTAWTLFHNIIHDPWMPLIIYNPPPAGSGSVGHFEGFRPNKDLIFVRNAFNKFKPLHYYQPPFVPPLYLPIPQPLPSFPFGPLPPRNLQLPPAAVPQPTPPTQAQAQAQAFRMKQERLRKEFGSEWSPIKGPEEPQPLPQPAQPEPRRILSRALLDLMATHPSLSSYQQFEAEVLQHFAQALKSKNGWEINKEEFEFGYDDQLIQAITNWLKSGAVRAGDEYELYNYLLHQHYQSSPPIPEAAPHRGGGRRRGY